LNALGENAMKRLMFLMTALMMISITGLTACQSGSNVQETPPEQQNTSETQEEGGASTEAETIPASNDNDITPADTTPAKTTEKQDNQSSVDNQLRFVDYSTEPVEPTAEVVNLSPEGTVLSQSEGEPYIEEEEIDYSEEEVDPEAELFDEEMENEFEDESMNFEEENMDFSEDELGEESEYLMEEDDYESEEMMPESEYDYTEQ
jgi:hypothetical protein